MRADFVLNENYFECQKPNEWAEKKGDKEIIYKRILMDDPLLGNWLSLLIMWMKGMSVKWCDNLCAGW